MQKSGARRAIVFPSRIVLDRKVAFGLLVVIVLAVTAFVGISADVDTSGPWHYLQGISKSLSDMTSIDSTGSAGVGLGGPNNVIDNADVSMRANSAANADLAANSVLFNGLDSSSFCALGDTRPGCGIASAAGQHAGYCVAASGCATTVIAPATCLKPTSTTYSCGCQTGWTKKQALVSASLIQSTDGSSLSFSTSYYSFCIKN